MNTQLLFTGEDLLVNRNKIACTLKEIRKKKGLNQEQVAELMNVSRTTISKIENGKFNCSLDYLSKFAFVLGFDIVLSEIKEKSRVDL